MLMLRIIQCGLNVEKQKALPVVYKNIKVDAGYRLDIVVNNAVIIEIKAVEELHPVQHRTANNLFKTIRKSNMACLSILM